MRYTCKRLQDDIAYANEKLARQGIEGKEYRYGHAYGYPFVYWANVGESGVIRTIDSGGPRQCGATLQAHLQDQITSALRERLAELEVGSS